MSCSTPYPVKRERTQTDYLIAAWSAAHLLLRSDPCRELFSDGKKIPKWHEIEICIFEKIKKLYPDCVVRLVSKSGGVDITVRGIVRLNVEVKAKNAIWYGQVRLVVESGVIVGISRRSRSSKKTKEFMEKFLSEKGFIGKKIEDVCNTEYEISSTPIKDHYISRSKENKTPGNKTPETCIYIEGRYLMKIGDLEKDGWCVYIRKKGNGYTAFLQKMKK